MRGILASLVLVAALGASPALSQTPPAVDQAELSLWNTVKDSTNPLEIQVYLSVYPNGVFAGEARQKLATMGVSAPVAPPPVTPVTPPPLPPVTPPPFTPPPPPPISPVVPPPPPPTLNVDLQSPAIIREVQTMLYNLNYNPGDATGTYTTATREAISKWQGHRDFTATGILTDDQYMALRNQTPPKRWGAIAFVANGSYGSSWNYDTRREAEESAIAGCRKHAGRNAKCTVLSTFDEACGAIAKYSRTIRGTNYFGTHGATRTTLDAARRDALADCGSAERAGNTCKIITVFCANGAHQ